ncbi:hypothetical protein NL676_007317 [Syzygium grande]|nr:hypothetical protein NL676_007317 [Syzygium grande]
MDLARSRQRTSLVGGDGRCSWATVDRARRRRRRLEWRRRLRRRLSEAASASAQGDRPRSSEEAADLAHGRRWTSLMGSGGTRSSKASSASASASEARAEAEVRESLAGGRVGAYCGHGRGFVSDLEVGFPTKTMTKKGSSKQIVGF